jgi:SAM-dependent methyltransferase
VTTARAKRARPGPARPPEPGRTPRPAGLSDQLVEDLVDAGSREHYADAALYDYEYRRRRADVTFYRELARRRGADRILELGAGTGRITVPLARDGHAVVAVDQSDAMLARLTARVDHLPPAVAGRITPVRGDLRGFTVPGRFPLAIAAFNVLEHLYTRGEFEACLQRVAAHLAPGGAFAFDVQLPDLAWLARDPTRRWAKTRFTHPVTGQSMFYSTNHDYDPISQIVLIRLYYDPADEPAAGGRNRRTRSGAVSTVPGASPGRPLGPSPGRPLGPSPGRPLGPSSGPLAGPGRQSATHSVGGMATASSGTRVVKLSQRKFFPAELEALVDRAGFRVTERYGDFSFRPLDGTADSQVVVCEPRPKRPRKRPVLR